MIDVLAQRYSGTPNADKPDFNRIQGHDFRFLREV